MAAWLQPARGGQNAHSPASGERLFGAGNDNHAADPQDNNPQMVWEKLVSQHDQIFMVLCGHRTPNGLRQEQNRLGHQVFQILSDYQSPGQTAKAAGIAKKGDGVTGVIGDGWMRLMTFDMAPVTPVVRVRTYSTHYKKFSTEIPEYAAWYKAQELLKLTDAEFQARDDFRFDLTDFRARFSGAKQ